jgi:DNA helicase-2/ATP-dependent DNA helicase PcrA
MDFIEHLSYEYAINLNEQQQQGVLNIDGPVLMLAVPGGGKTTVIVSRCANMIMNHNIRPDQILTLTFSKASALDMKARFSNFFGSEAEEKPHFSTIHSFGYSVLRTYYKQMRLAFPTLIESKDSPISKAKLLRQLYQKNNRFYPSDDKVEELSNAICYYKNMPKDEIAEYKANITSIADIPCFDDILRAYESIKKEKNLIDYDDMLTKTFDLFERNEELLNAYRDKYRYINVDESQDTSYLQHQIIERLAKPRNNIFMVGDEDQSIYSFRAAYPKALLDFEKTYPGAQIFFMERNYRSTKSIVNLANKFIMQNEERYSKDMFTEKAEGVPVKYTCLRDKNDQYEHIAARLKKEKNLSEIAVLYRNNISAIPIADILDRYNIPFYLREAKTHFFNHWIINDIMSFFKLSCDPANTGAFYNIYYKMNAYISRNMAEFAAKNIASTGNVFDSLLRHPDLYSSQEKRILRIKKDIKRLAKMRAGNALECILGDLGYGEYLNRQRDYGSGFPDSLMLVISSLKSIAESSGYIPDFINRLRDLEQIMGDSKLNKRNNAVSLSTIHSSKGLEFEKVFIVDLFEGQFPSLNKSEEIEGGQETRSSCLEEEVRLFYVAATRAKSYLEFMSAKKVDGVAVSPSRFIKQFIE